MGRTPLFMILLTLLAFFGVGVASAQAASWSEYCETIYGTSAERSNIGDYGQRGMREAAYNRCVSSQGGGCNENCNDCGDMYLPLCRAQITGYVDSNDNLSNNPSGTPVYDIQGICIISDVITQVHTALDGAASTMFEEIRKSGLSEVFNAALTLYLAVYAMMFMLGVAQLNGWEVFVRLFKISLIIAMLSDTGLTFFSETVAAFFRDGVDDLIAKSTSIMATTLDEIMLVNRQHLYNVADFGDARFSVFMPLDLLIGDVLSPRSFAVINAAMAGGPGGWGMAYMLLFAAGILFLLLAIAKSLWIYLMSLLCTAFLLGLAPIFFIFLLFDRTKGIFDGWLKNIISFSLQPIFVLTFFGLFAEIMRASVVDVLSMPVCLAYFPVGTGNPTDFYVWQFADPTKAPAAPMVCRATAQGMVGIGTELTDACSKINEQISLGFMDLIAFLLMGFICYNFIDFVSKMTTDIVGGIDLGSMKGALHSLASQGMSQLNTQLTSGLGGAMFGNKK